MKFWSLFLITLVIIVTVKARFTEELDYKIYLHVENNPLCGVTKCMDQNTVCGIGFDSLPIMIKGEDCLLKDPISNYYETFRKESDDNEDQIGIDAIAYCPSGAYNMTLFGVLNPTKNYCINDFGDHVSFGSFFYPTEREQGKINFGEHRIFKTIMTFKYYGLMGISCTKAWDIFITINESVGCSPDN